MGIYGQDWSGYQSSQPSVSGIDFMFTKITEGLGYVNPRWRSQYNWAKSHGLVVGKYHYPHFGNSVSAELDYFAKNADIQPGDVIVLDWEGYDAANQGTSHARLLAYRDAWLKAAKAKWPNNPVGMYCNTDYWLNIDNNQNCGDFLWIATGGKPAGQPGIKYAWTIHQYSTAGGIDHDYANFKDRAAMKAWVNSFNKSVIPTKPPTVPTPPEDDLPYTEAQLRTIINSEVVKAVTSQSVRDELAFADFFFLEKVFSFTPIPNAAPGGIEDKVNKIQAELKAVLGKLDPAVVTALQDAVKKALSGTIVTGTVK